MSEPLPKVYFWGLRMISYPPPPQTTLKSVWTHLKLWDKTHFFMDTNGGSVVRYSALHWFIQVDQWKEDAKHHACGHLGLKSAGWSGKISKEWKDRLCMFMYFIQPGRYRNVDVVFCVFDFPWLVQHGPHLKDHFWDGWTASKYTTLGSVPSGNLAFSYRTSPFSIGIVGIVYKSSN